MYRNNKQWAPNTEALDDYVWTYIPLNESADSIEHHGVKGQKWGVRRYQNRDGSLTPEGMKRYNVIHTKDGRTFYREKNYKQLKVQKIFDGLSEADKIDLPEKIIDPDHTVYESYRRSSFLTLEGHVTDQDAHPVKGLVVRVGTAEGEREKGDAGYLVRQAIREKPHNDFVAEISPGNETAADFFVNNGFEYVLTENGIDYYRFNAPGDNVDEVMAELSEKRKMRRHENRISVDVPVTHSDIWNPNELYHHGIKGQKWGVRRFENYDGSLTEAGKHRYGRDGRSGHKKNDDTEKKKKGLTDKQKKLIVAGVAITATALAAYGAYRLYNKHGNFDYGPKTYMRYEPLEKTIEDYGTKPISIKAGKKLQRVSRTAVEDYEKKGQAFVSFMFSDNQRYKAKLPQEGIWKQKDAYAHELKLKTDLKAPSSRELAEIFLEQHPDTRDDTFRMSIEQGFIDQVADDDDVILKLYQKNANQLKDELLKRGYNAIIDSCDAAPAGQWRAPLIVLNPGDVFEQTGSHKIGKLETVIADFLK